ncbi:phosphonate transport system substrate-binding protein [Azotobacter vinelandii CA]|uniref:Phosphonate transport system substrate-binding protein n=2 Tax=Azotobacter vinelandii TaxID=354 RepID=C1DI19_AZOVD|nr:phosphate/phosphite/phosphonate ABC transporter substrate-binding protein [Azotobacter vinelandii]ACO76516.1 phosphonate transport system substrate-binding protein [Azotobacter vinelandii DJ]AGK17364.1 phosphonate transport system substrate-binding protein [Azotobacter vinelandii CA]AGK19185.1 phosphonate transport system substrate-binding protein [Azotobacter vinelandii CA6]WKN22289.1 phosphate/phosphite/phosphonate ABC transporter substrate-binding protein [Azotobacter vinelandii]SFX09831
MTRLFKRLRPLLAVLFLPVALAAHADDSAMPKKLTVGLLPGESAPTVMRLNEPLRAHLEKTLGIPVELTVGANYAATSEALRFGRIDIAYLGPITYILQSRKVQLEPFARPTHAQVGPTFQAVLIVPADSPARSLEDLRGKEVAFGDPASTSGTWVPRYMLAEAGLVSGRDYTLRVLGAHDAVALAVASKKVAAGGLSKPIYERLLKEGKIKAESVRILEDSPAIPEYMWTFRSGLAPEVKEKIRRAFISTSDPAALGVFRAEAFIPCVDSDVDRVRNWISVIEKDHPEDAVVNAK